MTSGHLIQINGIPSSGKSSLATALIHLMPGFEILTGDDIIRRIPYQRRVSQAGQLFELTLRVIVSTVESSNVISEGAWTQGQIVQARQLLGPDPLFVILRIDERERQKRESSRRDRQLGHPWDPSWHHMPGPDDLYDLVVDSKSMGIRASAEHVRQAALQRWSDLEQLLDQDEHEEEL